MTIRIRIVAVLLALGGCLAAAQAEYQARVALNNGGSFVVQSLDRRGDRIYSETGQASAAVSMVKEIEFRFAAINLKMCETMFRTDPKGLEGLLRQHVGPLEPFIDLPGNLGDYLVWGLRTQYWTGNRADAARTIARLRQSADPAHADAASLYFVLLLLDQGKEADAGTVFSGVGDPDAFSVPMAEYIRARLAMGGGDYRQAMRHAAHIIAFHGRDAEWMAPATALEAQIYRDTGQMEKAAVVADELTMAYPGTPWSALGEKIKVEATANQEVRSNE